MRRSCQDGSAKNARTYLLFGFLWTSWPQGLRLFYQGFAGIYGVNNDFFSIDIF